MNSIKIFLFVIYVYVFLCYGVIRSWNSTGNTDANNMLNYSGSGNLQISDTIRIVNNSVDWIKTQSIKCKSFIVDTTFTGKIYFGNCIDTFESIYINTIDSVVGYGSVLINKKGIGGITLNNKTKIDDMVFYLKQDTIKPDSFYFTTKNGGNHRLPTIIDSSLISVFFTPLSSNDTLTFNNKIISGGVPHFTTNGQCENVCFNFYDTVINYNHIGFSPFYSAGTNIAFGAHINADQDFVVNHPVYNFYNSVIISGSYGVNAAWADRSYSYYNLMNSKWYINGGVLYFDVRDSVLAATSTIYFTDMYNQLSGLQGANTYLNGVRLNNVVINTPQTQVLTITDSMYCNKVEVITGGLDMPFPIILDSLIVTNNTWSEYPIVQTISPFIFNSYAYVYAPFDMGNDGLIFIFRNGGNITLGKKIISRLVTNSGTYLFNNNDSLAITSYIAGDFDGTENNITQWENLKVFVSSESNITINNFFGRNCKNYSKPYIIGVLNCKSLGGNKKFVLDNKCYCIE